MEKYEFVRVAFALRCLPLIKVLVVCLFEKDRAWPGSGTMIPWAKFVVVVVIPILLPIFFDLVVVRNVRRIDQVP